MSTTRKVVIVAAVIVGICLLFLLMQNLTTEPSKAAATPPMLTCQPNHGKRPGCCHKTKAGNRKCDYPRRLSAARKEDVALADPVIDGDLYKPVPDLDRAAGCANSTIAGKIETAVVGWDVMHAQLWQKFCWEKGQITYLGDLRKQMDVTTWGNAHGWREDGWRDGPNGWTDYGGKNHGGHFAVKTAKFKACVPFPTGCVDSNSATIRLSLVQHAGGGWSGAVGK